MPAITDEYIRRRVEVLSDLLTRAQARRDELAAELDKTVVLIASVRGQLDECGFWGKFLEAESVEE